MSMAERQTSVWTEDRVTSVEQKFQGHKEPSARFQERPRLGEDVSQGCAVSFLLPGQEYSETGFEGSDYQVNAGYSNCFLMSSQPPCSSVSSMFSEALCRYNSME